MLRLNGQKLDAIDLSEGTCYDVLESLIKQVGFSAVVEAAIEINDGTRRGERQTVEKVTRLARDPRRAGGI